jgi:XTP/dITP diphosphohydrolase
MSTKRLLIATGNRNKAREIGGFLEGVPWRLAYLSEFPTVAAPEEDGETFEVNARSKAAYYCEQFRVACVADDSGIVVDALNGAPGVHSARYAGEGCTDADNNAKLLAALGNLPEARRTARFVCCCVLVETNGHTHAELGIVEGTIAAECRGRHGFGYDPLFIPRGYHRTFGELGPGIKASISHRAQAFCNLLRYLESRG